MELFNKNELLEVAARLSPQWLAGFFDGEGCVCIQKVTTVKNGYRLRVNITQADSKLLGMIAAQYGASYGPYAKKRTTRSGKDSTVYEIGWYGAACKDILFLLQDLVIVKRSQVGLGLKFLETMKGSGYRYGVEETTEREAIRNSLRGVNHAGPYKPTVDEINVS